MQSNPITEYDIAIVGGGVAGIYTAWRLMLGDTGDSELLQKWKGGNEKLCVAVFEGSERIGGRLLSVRPPGMPHMTCEAGGMRYVSSQKIISSLIENELKLPTHEQDVDEPINIAYLRGRMLRSYQLSDPDVLPYKFESKEREWLLKGNPASNLIGWAVEQLLPEVTTLNGEDLETYLQGAFIDGIPLYQHGLWNIIAKVMSNEAYEIAKTTVGYDVLGMNLNAVDAIAEYFNFTPSVKYYLLNDGYDAVPWTMQQQYEQAGGEVHLNSWLQSFDETTLEDGSQGVELQFSGELVVKAKAIVLAMPKRSLELLLHKGPVMDPVKAPHMRIMMNAVEPVDLYKMLIAYDQPWWEKEYVKKGRSVTDLPVRQCYYWGVEGREPGGNPKNTNAIIMAYNDMLSAEFWGGLRTVPLGSGDAVNWDIPGGRNVTDLHPPSKTFQRKNMPHAPADDVNDWGKRLRCNWDMHPAPEKMVTEMHRQLMLMHNVTNAPQPLEAAFIDWSDDPYGGAVHFWNSGYKSWEVIDAITQPVEGFPCYVCGEAYSTNQTWVEGALQTAEIVLQKHFSLKEPKWLENE